MESTGKTPENAHEAMRLIDEIIAKEKSYKTAVFRRLGISGIAFTQLANRTGCTTFMLERVRTEHARVCGAAVASKAAKSRMIVAPREVPAPTTDETEDDELEDETEEFEPVEDEEDADDEEQDDDVDDGDAPPRPSERAPRPRFGPTVPGKGAPLLAPERSELHRAADVITALGGIDNAERVVSIVLALKGAA